MKTSSFRSIVTRGSIIALGLLATGCGEKQVAKQAVQVQKVYEVRKLPKLEITIDGVPDEAVWEKANLEKGFQFPWKDEESPPTEFRALCDGESLYFSFRVEDEDIVVVEDFKDEADAIGEDRVEMYFSPDPELKEPYYCVEMDSRGRKFDYKAVFFRKLDFDWDFPEFRLAAAPLKKGYTVEGAVRLKTLESLGLPSLDSGKLNVGVYRAEFSHGEGPKPIENWVSWIDIQTPEEDYHVPGTMGVFRLAE